MLIWVFLNASRSWSNVITIGLVLMYILANIGLVKYDLTEGRGQFNPLPALVVPVVVSAVGVVVVGEVLRLLLFTSSGLVFWGLMCSLLLSVTTIVALICTCWSRAG